MIGPFYSTHTHTHMRARAQHNDIASAVSYMFVEQFSWRIANP